MKKILREIIVLLIILSLSPSYAAKLDVNLTPQEEKMWCWAATSECIIEFYGGEISQTEILQEIYGKIDPNQSGQPDDMVRALNLFDCNAKSYTSYNLPSSETELKIAADNKHPSTLGHNRQHVITYCGYTESGGSTVYHIMDPWPVDQGEWADYTHAEVLNNHLGPLDLIVTTDREIVGGTKDIVIVSPESGDELEKGVQYSIRWEDGPDNDVKIALKKGSSTVKTIAASAPNNGSYNWTPSDDLSVGSSYTIVITDVNDNSSSAESGAFSIIENTSIKYTLSVTDGSGDGEYPAGTAVQVSAEAPSSDKIFSKWTGSDVSVFEDVNSSVTYLTMPAGDFTAIATFEDRPEGSENLVILNLWESVFDDLSSCTLDSSKVKSDTLLKSEFTVGACDEANSVYPYSEFATYLEGDYTKMMQIEVTYKSDKKVWLVLPQEGLSDSGASYQAEVPASASWTTKYFDVSRPTFDQPEWVSGSLEKELDKEKIQGVSFMADGYDQTTDLQLKCVYLYGFIEATPISNNTKLSSRVFNVSNIQSSGFSFNIVKDGKYDIKIYSANGKVIKNIDKNFKAGTHQISWNNKLMSSQVVFLKIIGGGQKAILKTVVR